MQNMKFVRFHVKFERASMYDIENLTTAPSKQSENVRVKEIQITNGNCSLPLSLAKNSVARKKSFKKKREKAMLQRINKTHSCVKRGAH